MHLAKMDFLGGKYCIFCFRFTIFFKQDLELNLPAPLVSTHSSLHPLLNDHYSLALLPVSSTELCFALIFCKSDLFVFLHSLSAALPASAAPKAAFLFSMASPLFWSRWPPSALSSPCRLPLNPIFHSWTTANFPPVLRTALSLLLEHA